MSEHASGNRSRSYRIREVKPSFPVADDVTGAASLSHFVDYEEPLTLERIFIGTMMLFGVVTAAYLVAICCTALFVEFFLR